jgi:hypothetical protein
VCDNHTLRVKSHGRVGGNNTLHVENTFVRDGITLVHFVIADLFFFLLPLENLESVVIFTLIPG